jgi:ABC-type nitrate/sulfonate/bicarbonate transport system permease component
MVLATMLNDIAWSFGRVVFATVISWICCICVGIVLHKFKLLYHIFLPVINFLRQISPFVWLPFAILLIGLGELPIAIVLFTAMFFPGVIMVFEAIESFPRDVYEEGITSGANHFQMVFQIELPILWKQLVNIFRILWSVGWSTVIAAEMLGVSQGLGFRLLDFRYLLEYKSMLIYIAIIGIIGITSDRIILCFARKD